MPKYKLNADGSVNDQEMGIYGIHPGIWRWQGYLDWLDTGGIAEPFDTRTPEEIATEANDIAAQKIRGEASAKLAALGNPYSNEERETWITQEAEARVWTANNSANCPMITAMATARGIPLSLMVQKIIENANLFKGVAGHILGAQQAALDLIQSQQ